MATTLSQLRKNKSAMYDKIVKDLDSGGKQFSNEEDKRFWKISRDKAGNGSAIIRFLPAVNGDEIPWVRVYSYGFKGPSGRWYINESPSTIGQPDPVMEYNRECYERGEEGKKDAKTRSRRTQFISNIVVVKDPANPDNEGKVFLFKYGKKILDMITSKAKPEFEDQDSIEVWDLDEGANLKLRIKNKDNYPNYDSSEWASQSALCDGDEEQMQAAIDACHKLAEFTDPKRFKSYEALKTEFDKAMNGSSTPTAADRASKAQANDDDDAPFDLEKEVQKASESKPKAAKVSKPKVEDDDDDGLDEFKKLLEDI